MGIVVFVFILVLIVFDCYYLVLFLYGKKGCMMFLRVKFGIVISWLIVVIFEIFVILVMKYDIDWKICFEDWFNIGFVRVYILVILFFDFILLFIFMVFVYSKVIYCLWCGSNYVGIYLVLFKWRKKVIKFLLIIIVLCGVCLFFDIVIYVFLYFGF